MMPFSMMPIDAMPCAASDARYQHASLTYRAHTRCHGADIMSEEAGPFDDRAARDMAAPFR